MILLSLLNFSKQSKIQGSRANTRISGLKVISIAIKSGKKLSTVKVANICIFLNLKNLNR